MKIEIKQRKLEDTLIDLNVKGYTVIRSKIDGENIILTAEKIKIPSSYRFNSDPLQVEIYNKKQANFSSLWNGLKMRWLKL
jgi:hypothetical protein